MYDGKQLQFSAATAKVTGVFLGGVRSRGRNSASHIFFLKKRKKKRGGEMTDGPGNGFFLEWNSPTFFYIYPKKKFGKPSYKKYITIVNYLFGLICCKTYWRIPDFSCEFPLSLLSGGISSVPLFCAQEWFFSSPVLRGILVRHDLDFF